MTGFSRKVNHIKENILHINFRKTVSEIKRLKINAVRKINRYLIGKLPVNLKYIGGPKNSFLTYGEIDSYVAKKRKSDARYSSWKFFSKQLKINDPVYTIGKPMPGAEVNAYIADTTEHVYLMPNIRIFSKDFFTLTEDNYLLVPVSNYYGNARRSHPSFGTLFLQKCRKLRGRSIIVRGGAYWHKMQDGLPALYLARLAGFDFDKIDHFIIQDKNIDKNSIFTRIGIPLEKQRRLFDEQDAYDCEELIFSSWYDRKGNWYKEYLLESIKPVPVDKKFPQKIYISRSRVNTRKVLNETEVVSFLSHYGFECIYNEDLTIDEQIALFQNATNIISCHGSQLTNIIFCKPGTNICEIRHINHAIHYRKAFHDLSNGFGLNYFLLYSEKGEVFRDEFNKVVETDTHMYIDLLDLKEMMGKMGLTEIDS